MSAAQKGQISTHFALSLAAEMRKSTAFTARWDDHPSTPSSTTATPNLFVSEAFFDLDQRGSMWWMPLMKGKEQIVMVNDGWLMLIMVNPSLRVIVLKIYSYIRTWYDYQAGRACNSNIFFPLSFLMMLHDCREWVSRTSNRQLLCSRITEKGLTVMNDDDTTHMSGGSITPVEQ